MGFIGDAIEDAADFVGDVFNAVGDFIEDVMGVVDDAIDWIEENWEVALVVGGLVGLGIATGFFSTVLTNLAAAASQILAGFAIMDVSFWASMSLLAEGFATFLSAIHFKTLLAVHLMALQTSEDYRKAVMGIYNQVSLISSAMGFNAQFLNLAFQNTRAIILDASSALGRSYDIAQITWLNTYSNLLERFSTLTEKFKNSPGDLFLWLSHWYERPALNAKANGVKATLGGLNGALKSVTKIFQDVQTVRNDLEQFVHDLPQSIRKEILPKFKEITKTFDTFIDETYKPSIKTLENITETLQINQDNAVKQLNEITSRIRYPGDYLLEIERLTGEVKTDQENKIADLATRRYGREVEKFSPAFATTIGELSSIKALQHRPLKDLIPRLKERKTPVTPAGKPPEPRKTWNVGDY